MMDLSVSEWKAFKTAADKLQYDVKDKPSQLYFGKKLNLKNTQVKILCSEARVPTAPAQVLDEDEFYSIVEHIVKRAEEIEHYVKERDDRVKQLKTGKNTNTNTNSGSSTSSCCGEGTGVEHAAAVAVPVAVLSSISERSMSPHDVCSSKVKIEHATVDIAAATATAVDDDATAAEYTNGYAANGVNSTQQHSDDSTGYGHAYFCNEESQQVGRT
jgi:hypothetical protein